MKIENFKDLEKAIKVCRKHGIDSLKIDNIEFKLGLTPETPVQLQPKQERILVAEPNTMELNSLNVKTWEEMTDEEKLFYSVQERYVSNT